MSPPSAAGAVLGAVASAPLSLFGVHGAIPATIAVARGVALYALLPVALVALCWRAARAGGTGPAQPGGTRAVTAATGLALAMTVVLAPVVYPWYAAAPAAVLAAAAGSRLLRGTAVAVAVLSFIVLPDSLNLAIVTRWPGAVVEVIALVALTVWATLRRRRAALPRQETAGATPSQG
jgi:alpha-1,6-mannosyltransferase